MNNKIMICALIISTSLVGMEDEAITPLTLPTPSAPAESPNMSPRQRAELDKFTLPISDEKKRIDDPSLLNSNQTPSSIQEPDAISKSKKPQTAMSKLLAMGYEQSPKGIQMVCDKVAEHPDTAGAAVFVASECCMWQCCPEVFKVVNSFALGWAANIVYRKTCKEKTE